MSLEQIINDNTAALIANTAALTALSITTHNTTLENPVVQPKPGPAAPQPQQAPAGQPAVPQLTYAAVAEVVTAFVKAHGRAPAVILLQPLKATTIIPFKEKPAELAQIHAIFTDPVKTAAAIAAAAAAAKA